MTKKTVSYVSAGLMYLLVLVGLAILSPAPLNAQSFFGSIVGTVTDSTGAIVPGAAVTITDVATNDKHTAQSNAAGDYSFVNLVPASYKVEVQKTSFKRFVRDQVVVEVNATVRVEAALQVGETSETVEVTTQTPLLQTDSGSSGAVIEGKTVNEMPLNGRNSMNLLALSAGVIPLGNSMGATTLNGGGHTQVAEWSDYSIGGGPGGQNAMFVDGAPMNVLGGTSIGYVPAQDSVQEFNVTTNSSEADYGRFSGGVISMTTKSGTNAWHGTAYEYLRNNKLNANAFFTKQTELGNNQPNTRGQWNQNQYGGVFSGPIKKDKAFFMFNYEAFKARTASENGGAVPTLDMQAGYITAIDNNGNEIAGPDLTSNATLMAACPAATYTTAPKSGVKATYIPSSCWDATANVIKTEYPAPANGAGQNNFSTMAGTGTNDYSYTGRVDFNLSEKNRLFGRYTASNILDMSQETLPGGKKADGTLWHIGGGFTNSRTIAGVLGDTYTLTPTTVLDVRLSYMRWAESSANPTTNMDMSIFQGTWGTLQKSITETTNPSINFGGSGWTGGAFRGTGDGSKTLNDNDALAISLTKIVGKHSLKIGSEDRLMSQVSNAPPFGWIGFDVTNTYFTQNSWANFLLGLADDASLSNYREVGSYNWYQGYYATDRWQATRKLTVTAGLRWELPGNIKEKRDRQMVLIPGLGDTSTYWTSPTGKYTGATSIAALVNSSVYSDQGTEPARHGLFTPHVGLAYRLSDSDVIRGGYGYNILAPDTQTGMFPQNFSMNTISNSWNVANGPSYKLSNPFPTTVPKWANGLQQPAGRAGFDMTGFVGNTGLSAPVPTTKVPHTQQWNLSLSHQFKGDLLLEVAYSGARGTNIPMGNNLNELQPQFWANQTMPTPSADCGSTTGYAIWGSHAVTAQCSRPYAAYGSVKDTVGNIGSYTYNSLPIKLEKRFKSGGLINASYVWSKALGDVNMPVQNGPTSAGGVQDYYNLGAEHALASYDVPHRVIVSYVLNLPFGKGQKYLSSVNNGVAQHLISGWAVNGISSFQKGFPLSFGSASYAGGGNVNIPVSYGAGSLRPNVVPGCNKWMSGSVVSHVLNGTPILNANCWSAPAANTDYTLNGTTYHTTLGNQRLYVGDLRAPGAENFDLSAVKKTNITESVNLEFRFEFFNLFNHMQFPAESTTVGSSGGGFGSAAFGVINSSSQNPASPRIGQASLRLSF